MFKVGTQLIGSERIISGESVLSRLSLKLISTEVQRLLLVGIYNTVILILKPTVENKNLQKCVYDFAVKEDVLHTLLHIIITNTFRPVIQPRCEYQNTAEEGA